MVFEITPEQQSQIDRWLRETVYPAEIAKQKKSRQFRKDHIAASCWAEGYPYAGAIGGGLTYEFANTSIGQVQAARYGEHRLDVTDYGNW